MDQPHFHASRQAAPHGPNENVVHRLLALNREFYSTVGPVFDATRQDIPSGMRRAVSHAPPGRPDRSLRVLDAGCGNGRLVHALTALDRPIDYLGVDCDAGLLDAAGRKALPPSVLRRLLEADLGSPGWDDSLPAHGFDFILCLAMLHHLPGPELRLRVVKELARLLAPGGRLVLSTWQFADSPRLSQRVLPWSTLGLTESDVEPGDVLLPWDAGVHAVRYVHLLDKEQLTALTSAAALQPLECWRADGRTEDMTLYMLCRHADFAASTSACEGDVK